ncbi:SRPBCC family protein [Hymenobacter sp. H14-R3]|uniref:SRPBCC family protein n=1 Tax=Hymenobacter sp. H14-R3 TaxID=3046308 RepID=UPI0024BA7EE4|nr:SRPBCC family protein [Hymenobacter sp. H14-R3]MDJ0365808.1 SRPBCC family protein [Hymenobacter sp. H14-R3]
MATIEIVTRIDAPQERCFYLALSVDLHAVSARQTNEEIIAGVRSGILQLHDSVTFRARHFGVWQTLTSKVTALRAPAYFRDDMQQGAFKSMWHAHYFEPEGATTLMRDVFVFASPLGWLGKLVDALVLKRYMRQFLQQRGAVVKQYAESDAWQSVLPVDLPGARPT